jgi:Tol biopolymer transport system component
MKTLALISTAALLGLAGSATAAEPTPRELLYVLGSGKGAKLYVVGEDGTGKRRLTKSAFSESQPAYSRDGKKIAFVSIRGTNEDIYTMNADGTGVRRLTTHSAGDTAPAFSPDGRRIAFVSLRSGNYKLFVMNADGSNERQLTRTANWVIDSSPSWSPDGRWIAFTSNRLKDGNPEIFKVRPDGTRVTRLTFTDTPGELSPDDGFPEWSRDGRSILFASTRHGAEHDLYVMNADGKNVRHITRNPNFDDWTAHYSRDGQRIAFWALGQTISDVYVVSPNGTGLRRVTRGATPLWRP